MRRVALLSVGIGLLLWVGGASIEFAATGGRAGQGRETVAGPTTGGSGQDVDRPVSANDQVHESGSEQGAVPMDDDGRQSFRFATYGDEAFWGGALQLHRALLGVKLGGVGPGVSPNTAMAIGLKFDMDALTPELIGRLKQRKVDFDDPATTAELLKLDAVLGMKGFFSDEGKLSSVGITCAVCHSTVDDSYAPGIGHRRDGPPNLDLNLGRIVSLAPNLKPTADRLGITEDELKQALASWGPGKYDADLIPMSMHFMQAGAPPPPCCRSRWDNSEQPLTAKSEGIPSTAEISTSPIIKHKFTLEDLCVLHF